MNEKTAQEEMDRLVYYSKRDRESLYDSKGNAFTQSNPFSVQAGPSKIVKGDLQRLPADRSYGAGSSFANTLPDDKGVPNAGIIFPNITRFPTNGSGAILGGKMTKSNTSIANVSFRLWLYQLSFPLVPSANDGELMQIRWARRDDRIGYLDFDTFIAGFNCAESQALIGVSQSLIFGMPYNSNALFGLLQTRSTYDALALEQMSIYLHVSCD